MIEKLDKLQKIIYKDSLDKCKQCKSYKECNQSLIGYSPLIVYNKMYDSYKIGSKKCDKAYGVCNSSLIELNKYDTVECENEAEIIKHYKERKSLYIYGKAGIGKTHYLYYLSKKYVQQGKNVYINHMQQILNDIKGTWNKDNSISKMNQDTIIERLQNIDVLIVDDLGNEMASEWSVLDVLQSIIDYRIINNKPIIISSNHTPREVGNIYARKVYQGQIKHIISRLEDLGAIEFKGKYWRNIK